MRDLTIKQDSEKRKLEYLPDIGILADIAQVFEAGAEKGYKRDSWQDVEPERYKAAFLRHLIEWWADEDSVDEETGLEHFQLMLCNAYMLWWLRKNASG